MPNQANHRRVAFTVRATLGQVLFINVFDNTYIFTRRIRMKINGLP